MIRTTYISLFLTSTGLEIGTFQISKPKEKSEKKTEFCYINNDNLDLSSDFKLWGVSKQVDVGKR